MEIAVAACSKLAMQFFTDALSLIRLPLPSSPPAIAADAEQVRFAIMRVRAARGPAEVEISAAGCRRDDALLAADQEAIGLAEAAISAANLQLERLSLLEDRLRARASALSRLAATEEHQNAA